MDCLGTVELSSEKMRAEYSTGLHQSSHQDGVSDIDAYT
jgi:hypothetical protein